MRSFLIRTSITTHRHLSGSVKDAIANELKNSLHVILDQQETVLYYDPKHVTVEAAGSIIENSETHHLQHPDLAHRYHNMRPPEAPIIRG